jgi:hypothetical protein
VNKKILFLMLLAAAGVFVESWAVMTNVESQKMLTRIKRLPREKWTDKHGMLKRLIQEASKDFLKSNLTPINKAISMLAIEMGNVRKDRIKWLKSYIDNQEVNVYSIQPRIEMRYSMFNLRKRIQKNRNFITAYSISEMFVHLLGIAYKKSPNIFSVGLRLSQIISGCYMQDKKVLDAYKYHRDEAKRKNAVDTMLVYETVIQTLYEKLKNQLERYVDKKVAASFLKQYRDCIPKSKYHVRARKTYELLRLAKKYILELSYEELLAFVAQNHRLLEKLVGESPPDFLKKIAGGHHSGIGYHLIRQATAVTFERHDHFFGEDFGFPGDFSVARIKKHQESIMRNGYKSSKKYLSLLGRFERKLPQLHREILNNKSVYEEALIIMSNAERYIISGQPTHPFKTRVPTSEELRIYNNFSNMIAKKLATQVKTYMSRRAYSFLLRRLKEKSFETRERELIGRRRR